MQPNQESKDLESLRKFWHWADNENPSIDLFGRKGSKDGPLTEEAQEALYQAVQVVGLRAPDCFDPVSRELRPAIKALSLAILQAWELLSEDERIQKALSEEQMRDYNVSGTISAYFPGVTMTPISGCLDSFCGEEVTISFPGTDLPEKKGTLSKAGNGIYDFKALTGKAKDIIAERTPIRPCSLKLDLPHSPKWKEAEPNVYPEHSEDLDGYTAYNMRMPGAGAFHSMGQAVDLKPVEMGVTRSEEHDLYREQLLDMMGPNDREHLSVRVDSRGILFQSTEFK